MCVQNLFHNNKSNTETVLRLGISYVWYISENIFLVFAAVSYILVIKIVLNSAVCRKITLIFYNFKQQMLAILKQIYTNRLV